MFSELFANMMEEIKRDKNKQKNYKAAVNMSSFDKKISFLNRYFIFKKIRNVNTEKVQLELGEYNESDVRINNAETNAAVKKAKKIKSTSTTQIKKINKKLILAQDDSTVSKPERMKKPEKKKVILEMDDDDED